MKENWTPQPDDQEKADEAYLILSTAVEENPHIIPQYWVAATFTTIIDSFIYSGFTYSDFILEMESMSEFYKHRWEE